MIQEILITCIGAVVIGFQLYLMCEKRLEKNK